MLVSENCDFCNEFAGLPRNAFAVRYGSELRDRTAFESNSFKILPSLGQIVPGYLLVVPKQHYRALGDMSPTALQELDDIRSVVLTKAGALYGTYAFFEHGTRTPDCGGCGISHAHLHAVPFSLGADPVRTLKREFTFQEVNCFTDLKVVPSDSSYLYYEAATKERYVFYPSFVPSQYVRRLLAEALGSKDWDWRLCGKEEALLATYSQTSRVLAGQSR